MEKIQKKENKNISNSKNSSVGGKVSQLVSSTPLMFKKSDTNQRLFGGKDTVQKKENSTGLPDNLKNGIESLSGYSMDDVNSAWNAITDNAISGGLEFMGDLSRGQRAISSIAEASPFLTTSQKVVGSISNVSQRAVSMAARGANRLASMPRVSSMSQTASRVLAPLGVVSNAMALRDSVMGTGNSSDDNGLQRGVDSTFNAAGLLSAGIGTAAFLGEGVALGAAAISAAPVAAVAGAGAGGYALGQFADEQLGISDGLSSGMVAVDSGLTSGLRAIGAYDESKPAYTQTIGYQLAEILPSWMQ